MKKLYMLLTVLFVAALLVGCASSIKQAAELQEPAEAMDVIPEGGENKAAESDYSSYAEPEIIGFTYSDAAILQTETIGGLKLGMTEQEFSTIMGQPDNTSNVSMESPDGAVHFNWFYDTGTEQNNDTVLALADIGDGWFLNEISLSGDSTLRLSTGIGIGSTDGDIAVACPLAVQTEEVVVENDQPISRFVYTVEDELTITTKNGVCTHIRLGPWLQMPPEEAWETETEPQPYDLVSDEIIIYRWADQQWNTTTVIDRAAKGISTVLTISEPEVSTGEKADVSAWMDFRNGTVVELQGSDRAAVWTYEDDFDPDRTDGLTYQLGGVFLDLDDYVEKALADPDAGWKD